MDIISFFFQPLFFYALLAVLFVISAIALFSLGGQEKESAKKRQQDLENDKMRIAGLEDELVKKEKEYALKITQMETAAKGNEESLRQRIQGLEAQVAEAQKLKEQFLQVESNIKSKEELLRKELANKEELDKKAKTLSQELEKSKRELSVANQMYEGVKGQYQELEEKFSQLFQQFLAEQKKNQAANNIQKPQQVDAEPEKISEEKNEQVQPEEKSEQSQPEEKSQQVQPEEKNEQSQPEEKIQPQVDLSRIPRINIMNIPNMGVPPDTGDQGQDKEIPPSEDA